MEVHSQPIFHASPPLVNDPTGNTPQ